MTPLWATAPMALTMVLLIGLTLLWLASLVRQAARRYRRSHPRPTVRHLH